MLEVRFKFQWGVLARIPCAGVMAVAKDGEISAHLHTLACLAAKTWQELHDMPGDEKERLGDAALLDNALAMHRRFADQAMNKDRSVRLRAARMKGFVGLLRDTAFIIDTAVIRFEGMSESAEAKAEIARNLAASRAYHFPASNATGGRS